MLINMIIKYMPLILVYLPDEYKKDICSYSEEKLYRFSYHCFLINNFYFQKEWNINGYFANFLYYNNDIFDTGTEFFYFCIRNKINIKVNETNKYNDTIYHIKPNPLSLNNIDFKMNKNERKNFEKRKDYFQKSIEVSKVLQIPFERLYNKI